MNSQGRGENLDRDGAKDKVWERKDEAGWGRTELRQGRENKARAENGFEGRDDQFGWKRMEVH